MKEDYGGCEETDPDMLDLQMLIFNCNLPTGHEFQQSIS
jgi:hypothetical protein